MSGLGDQESILDLECTQPARCTLARDKLTHSFAYYSLTYSPTYSLTYTYTLSDLLTYCHLLSYSHVYLPTYRAGGFILGGATVLVCACLLVAYKNRACKFMMMLRRQQDNNLRGSSASRFGALLNSRPGIERSRHPRCSWAERRTGTGRMSAG